MRLILRISQPCSGPGRVLGRRICYEEHSRGNDPFGTFPVVTWYNFGGMAILIVYCEVLYCDRSDLQRRVLPFVFHSWLACCVRDKDSDP